MWQALLAAAYTQLRRGAIDLAKETLAELLSGVVMNLLTDGADPALPPSGGRDSPASTTRLLRGLDDGPGHSNTAALLLDRILRLEGTDIAQVIIIPK